MNGLGLAWVMRPVDAILRRRLGIVEFTHDPDCVVRISRGNAASAQVLPSGDTVLPGAPILEIHLWNERMPPLPVGGGTAAWGNLLKRQLRHSLGLVADYVEREQDCRDIAAIVAQPVYPRRLGPLPLTRVCQHLGWEVVPPAERESGIAAWFDNLLVWLLIAGFNPAGLRRHGFAHGRIEVWMSRTRLLRRYGSERVVAREKIVVRSA